MLDYRAYYIPIITSLLHPFIFGAMSLPRARLPDPDFRVWVCQGSGKGPPPILRVLTYFGPPPEGTYLLRSPSGGVLTNIKWPEIQKISRFARISFITYTG